MQRIFADTSYWIGLVNPRDQVHQKAVSLGRELSSVTRLTTTEMVLVETLNGLSETQFRALAGRMVSRLRQDQALTIIPQTPAQFQSALERFRKAPDKSWSLTDCASFEVMEAEGIQEALTHDRHFVQAGFTALLR